MRTAFLILVAALSSCSSASIPTSDGVIELTTFGSEVSFHHSDGSVLVIDATGSAKHATTEIRNGFGLWRILDSIENLFADDDR